MKIQLVVKGLIVCTLLILLIGCVPPQATIIPPTSLNPTIAPTMTTMSSTVSTEVVSETLTLTPTIEPSSTVVPTDTPTLLPTPTVFLPPADGILFQDNFDTSMNSNWIIRSGNWIIADGKLKMFESDGESFEWITLSNPAWRNYLVNLDLVFPKSNSIAEVAISVRNVSPTPIGVVIRSTWDIYWSFVGGNSLNSSAIVEKKELTYGFDYSIQLEIKDDTYILRVDGQEVQRVIFDGPESGGISLGVECNSEFENCPSFDNVRVTYLP